MRRFILNFVIIGFFFFLTTIVTSPAIFNLSNKLIGDGGDNYHHFIFQFISSEKIKKLNYPFSYSDILRYPMGFNFGTGYDSVLIVLTGAFFSLFMNNITAYNITLLIYLTLNGLFSFLLFRYISNSYLLGIIGGVIYGYSSYVIARTAGHTNLFFVGGIPLFVYALLRIKNYFSKKNIFLLFLAVTLIFLTSFQYFILFTISFTIIFLFSLLFFPSCYRITLNNIIINKHQILLLVVPFLTVIIIFSSQHIFAFIKGDFFKPNRNEITYLVQNSPSIKDFLIPNNFLPLKIKEITKNLNNSFSSIERVVFIGWAEMFLFLFFIVRYRNIKLKRFILLIVSVFFIITLGFINPETNIKLPYYFFQQLFPFSFINEPGRFFIIFYLFLTIGIIAQLKEIYNKKTIPKIVSLIVLIIIILIIERLPNNYWLSDTFHNKPFVKVVKKEKGTAVLDIPISFHNSVYDIFPYVYGKKIVSGYFHWFADTDKPKSFVNNNNLTRFMCGQTLKIDKDFKYKNKKLIQVLKAYDIKTIVVHKNDPLDHAKYYFPECVNVRMQTSLFLPQLLMPDPTEKQKILSLFFPVIPGVGDNILIPADGVFYLDGIHAYPIDWLPIHIYINDIELIFNQVWTNRGNKNATLDPFLKIQVKKGDKIGFKFNKNNNLSYSFVKIWYRYIPVRKTDRYISDYNIEKIYEDDDAAVFRILK